MSWYFVTAVSRRRAQLRSPNGDEIEARIRSSAGEIVCGDLVTAGFSGGEPVIDSVKERKNLLSRSYRGRTKYLAANLDHLFIVAAVGPLFNTVFIDRTVAACTHEGIPFSLVLNKIDLGTEDTEPLVAIYRALSIPVLYTCAKSAGGIAPLETALEDSAIGCAAVCGISGVGKSSLLRRLVPGSEARISEVSEKTGQGRQTTTMSVAYLRRRGSERTQYVIDLPGLQHFGISHLSLQELRCAFSEFVARSGRCQFLDCAHISEPRCAILDALHSGDIARSRYDSYLHMREEIVGGRQY